MKIRKSRKIVSIIVALSIILCSFPAMIYAESDGVDNIEGADYQPAQVLYEINSLRSESIKHFRMSDGTYTAVNYNIPVHYYEDGIWKDIDNTLALKNEENGNVYETLSNSFNVKFAENASSDKLISIDNSGYEIAFSMAGDINENAESDLVDLSSSVETSSENECLENNYASMKYENILENTDVQYIIEGSSLKENIIVKSGRESYEFVYNIVSDGLTAALKDDGSIIFKNSADEEIFDIPAPYMYDNDGEISDSVEYFLSHTETGYMLTVLADPEWINDSERQFPVVIDPMVNSSLSSISYTDTYVASGSPGVNYSTYSNAKAGLDANGYYMTYIDFDLPELPYASAIVNASLSLTGSINISGMSSVPRFALYDAQLDSSVSLNTINWSNQSTAWNSGAIIDYFAPVNTDTQFDFNITKLAKKWDLAGETTGIGIKLDTSSISGSLVMTSNTSECINPAQKPVVSVNYTVITGLDSDYEYHTIDIGDLGTAYINDFTGHMTLKRYEMGFEGNVMPVSIYSIYTINRSGEYDWKTNYHQDILYSPSSGMYSYFDGDGVYHYFKFDENITNEASEITGSVWTLENEGSYDIKLNISHTGEISDYTDYENISLKRDGEIYSFDQYGRLVKMTKEQATGLPEQAITITYEPYSASAVNCIDKITDGSGRIYEYTYTTDSYTGITYLSKIYFYGRPVNGAMDSSLGTTANPIYYVNMSTILYDRPFSLSGMGYSGYYSYNASNGHHGISTASYNDFKSVSFGYSGRRVTSIQENAVDTSSYTQHVGEAVTISYENDKTTFTSSSGNYELKQFDNYGHTVTDTDDRGLSTYNNYESGSLISTSSSRIIPWRVSNIITNPFFDEFNGSTITGWNRSGICNTNDDTRVELSEAELEGNPSMSDAWYTAIYEDETPSPVITGVMKITGDMGHEKYFSQTVTGVFNEGDVYSLTAWGMAQAAAHNAEDGRFYGVQVWGYTDAGTYGLISDALFSSDIDSWQSASTAVVVPYDNTSLEIRLVYSYNKGIAYFDNISLIKDGFIEFSTNSQAIEDTEEAGGDTETEEPEYTEIYDDYGRLLSSLNSAGKGQIYTYDNYNNILTSTNTDGSYKMVETYTYKDNGNLLVSYCDAAGNTVQYNYNSQTGRITGSTDARNVSTSYTYNSGGATTQISSGGSSNTYSYNSSTGLLLSIGTSISNYGYSFGYNYWHDLSSVSVKNTTSGSSGTITLAQYAYSDDIDRLLETLNYGNGDSVTYTYDEYNSITAITVDGETTPRYQFGYSASGELQYIKDNVQNLKTYYGEDGITVKSFIGSTEVTVYTKGYTGENAEETGTVYTESYGGSTFNRTSLYDGREAFNYTDDEDIIISSVKDDLDRTDVENISITDKDAPEDTAVIYSADYQYAVRLSGSDILTSDRIYMAEYALGTSGSDKYYYSYDANGNITEIRNAALNLIYSYVYDSLGQLTRVNDAVQNKTFNYIYDQNGNVLWTFEYTYTTGSSYGNYIRSYTYSYDSIWKDKLTSYDGKAITYDTIGNPLTYDGNTYAWSGGRQLASLTNSTYDITYSYNSDGIRTSKTVESGSSVINHKYINGESGNVIFEEISDGTDTSTLYFRYTEDGGLTGFDYNGTAYFYHKNIQGDIVAVLDSAGAPVTTYVYDAWGNIISATGTLASTIGTVNPFRYRGYYYDTETGYYYLQSRYYNPVWGRFLNTDDVSYLGASNTLLSLNLFIYCENNVIKNTDPTGYMFGLDGPFSYNGITRYNRTWAVNYALRWYNDFNPNYKNYANRGGDCTNFVSQCMVAGGILMNKDWHSYSHSSYNRRMRQFYTYYDVTNSFVGVIEHFKYHREQSYVNNCIIISSPLNLGRYGVKKGDVIYFGNTTHKGIYGMCHAGIVSNVDSNEIYYAGHTDSRKYEELSKHINSYNWVVIMRFKYEYYSD